MSGWRRRLEKADEASRCDKGFVLSCVRREGLALELASQDLRADAEVVSAAAAQDPLALRFAAKALRADRDLVLSAVERCGAALRFAVLELRRDRQLVLAAVREDGLALEHAGRELRGDIGVVMAAVEQNGMALEHARTALRGERDIVLAAVKRRGCALEYAAEELRRDVDICCVACRNDPDAVRLIEDPEVERKARLSMLQDMRNQLHRDMEAERLRAEQEKQARAKASETMLKLMTQKAEPRKGRRKSPAPQETEWKPFKEERAAWLEKTAVGGRLYRMIENWREDNMDKIKKKGTLDLGDPWERQAEKIRPAPPEPEVQQVFAPQSGTVQQQQRMVMSLVKKEVYSGPEPEIVKNHISELVFKMTGASELDMDTPLMESGVDSLMAVDLRTQLTNDFKINLSSTVMFNYPTMGGLASYLVDELTANKVPGWGRVIVQEVMEEVMVNEPQQLQPQPQAHVSMAAPVQPAYQAPAPELVQEHIRQLVANMTGATDIDGDTPLMESGLDSLASVDLRTSLQQEFTLDLPSTVMFNYPTMTGLAGYLVEQLEMKQIPWGPK